MHQESCFRIAPKWALIKKMAMTSKFSDMESSSNFLYVDFFSLAKFNYWSKFHVNIITGSEVMTISFYKGLTRNSEIGKTHVWVLPNIWRLGRVRNTKSGTNISNKILLNATNGTVKAFTISEPLRENQQGVKLPPPPTQMKVKAHIA